MNSAKWLFSDNTMASEELVDQFADSKFGIDKWESFAREIIQNSLDAVDDPEKPVEVVFDMNKNLTLSDIPGGKETRYVLDCCYQAATNHQTKNAYKIGLKTLDANYVYCLKISDYNTIGVKSGRDEAWGALVFDEGKSMKQRSGSAGSHGVGKKAPFIISNVNTVFYATKNKYEKDGELVSDSLLQGKTTLINWKDKDGVSKVPKGWFGIPQHDVDDPRNAILPITGECLDEINPYFVRKDRCGTDVIIIGLNAYKDEEGMRRNMISAVLENFYIAILSRKLEIVLFGEKINQNTFWKVLENEYVPRKEQKNDLRSSLEAFDNQPSTIFIEDKNGAQLGYVDVFFKLGSENNKKYYSIIRSHGMRIEDIRINIAEQAFSAIVITYGEKLNELLSSLENAAHDKFVTNDETIDIDEKAVQALKDIKDKVKALIIENTHIDAETEQELEGVDDILMMPGRLNLADEVVRRKKIKSKPVRKKGSGMPSDEFSGRGGSAQGAKKHKTKNGGNGPVKPGNDFNAALYDEYYKEPYFSCEGKEYRCSFATKDNIRNASVLLFSINSDGRNDDTIRNRIKSAEIDGKQCNVNNGIIKGFDISAEVEHTMTIQLKTECMYRLKVDIFGAEPGGEKNE